MDFITEELRDAKEIQRLSIPAKRLKEKLAPIPSTFEALRRRWFWELLQNASDYNDKVSVRLELYNDKIVFSHNGAPFKPIDTENLISPDSGKDDEEIKAKDPIGQFGTGFISTHVLSSEITVSGIVASQKHEGQYIGVRFKLDRAQYESKDELIKSINKAEEQLETETYPVTYQQGEYCTQFSYDLSKPFPKVDAINAVEEGLRNIDELLPYAMIYMHKVEAVEITNHAYPKFGYPRKAEFKKGETSDHAIDIIHTSLDEKGIKNPDLNYHFKVRTENDAVVVVRVEGKKILSYPPFVTKLFCSLPMIGTEEFCLPFVLNSPKFIPATERHKVELSANDTANRKILTDGVIAFKALVDYLTAEKYEDFYHLCSFGEPADVNPTVNSWLRDFILKPIQSNLLSQSVITTNDANISLKLSETKIAYIPRDEFDNERYTTLTEITDVIQKGKVPRSGDVISWFNHLDFVRFGALKYTIEMVLKQIDEWGTMAKLTTEFKINPADWLIKVHAYVLKYHESFLDQYKIIPDQDGMMHTRKEDINWDDDVPIELKDIYQKITGKSFGRLLLEKEYEVNITLLPANKKKGEVDISLEIDAAFKNYTGDINSKNYLDALRNLFKWFKEQEDTNDTESTLKKTFEYFSRHKPQLFMGTFNEDEKDKAFAIVQSGKLQSLAKLAESKISGEEIELMTDNLEQVKSILAYLNQKVDDKTHASESTGNTGEEIVFAELNKKFGDFNSAQVIWASRDRNEPRYDFEILRDGKVILYVDAKTTNQGLGNINSIPFFVRKQQWEFLKDEQVRNKYLAARVTLSDNAFEVEWLSLNLVNIS